MSEKIKIVSVNNFVCPLLNVRHRWAGNIHVAEQLEAMVRTYSDGSTKVLCIKMENGECIYDKETNTKNDKYEPKACHQKVKKDPE